MKQDTIGLVLTDLLAACEAAYVNVAGAPTVPPHAYVSFGTAAQWQQDGQLTVSISQSKGVQPFPLTKLSAVKSAVVPAVEVIVEIVRPCWPVPAVGSAASYLPDPADIQAASLLLARDASTVYGYVANLAAVGGLFPSFGKLITTAEDVGVSPMTPLGPQGRMAGWRWPIQVKLAVL